MRAALLFFLATCLLVVGASRTAVDLRWDPDAAHGYISLSPIPIGLSGTGIAIEVQCYFSVDPSGSTRSSLVSFSDQQRTHTKDIELFFVGRYPRIRLGNSVLSSSLQVPNFRTWAHIVVNIYKDAASGNAKAQLFVNGVDQTGSLNSNTFSGPLLSTTYDRNFIGYNKEASGATSYFNGLVDSFYLYGKALDLATVQSHAALSGQDAPFDKSGLIFRMLFSETYGKVARAQSGDATDNSFVGTLDYPRAAFTSGDFGGWLHCNGWGDPHWTNLVGAQFDTRHVEGFFSNVACKDGDTSVFTVQSWHTTGCCWGGATVLRAINVRLGTSMFQWAASQAIGNGIAGPYVYKELIPGVAATDIPWTSFNPAIGSPKELSSGLTFTLTSSSTFQITGAPYGLIRISENGNYANLDLYVSQNPDICTRDAVASSSAVCDGYKYPVPSWIFNGGNDTPTPLSVAPPVAEPPPPTCPAALLAVAETNCKRSFPAWETVQSVSYAACIMDVCSTGNPWTPPPVCTPGVPCCNCASTGVCNIAADNSTSCTCDAGYGGADCSQVLDLVSLTLNTPTADYDQLPYVLTPHNLADAVAASASVTGNELAAANPWRVKNSLLFYVATVSYLDAGVVKNSQHLYIVNDGTSAAYTHTLALSYSTTFTTAAAVIGSGANIVAGTSQNPTSVQFNVPSGATSGLVLPNLPDNWCVTAITGSGAPAQVVVGSGNVRSQLDVMRVVNTAAGQGNPTDGLKICGKRQANPCANLATCSACTANAECGWCRTTGSCRFGRPAGPTDGTLCPAWAFTFADVTRRITQSYGYPVSPVDTTVVLASQLSAERSKDLPIEINVDMGFRFYSAWDVQIVFPNGPSNGADVAGLQTAIGDVVRRMNSYTNSAISVATYSSRASSGAAAEPNGDNGVFRLVFPLYAPTDANLPVMQGLVNAINVNNNAMPNQKELLKALKRASATQQPNWRNNARHLLVVFVDAAEASSTPASDLAEARAALLTYSVMPVFVVRPDATLRTTMRNLVRELGFGLVIDYSSPNAIVGLIERALTDASGAIATTIDTSLVGYVDTAKLANAHKDTLMVSGLSGLMRSRTTYPIYSTDSPVNGKVTQILAPGFGKATIEAIDSDSPYTNAPPVRMVVGQALDPYSTTASATLVYLSGKPADVLQSNDMVTAYIKSVNKGRVFQFDESALRAGATIEQLTEITGIIGGTTYQRITDIQGRVVYLPPANQFGDATDSVYDVITYRVQDECSPSPDGTVNVYVDYDNNKVPTTSHASESTNENAPLVITFTGSDVRDHSMNLVLTSVPTNPSGRASLAGSLYAFSAACVSDLATSYPTVPVSCGAALTNGASLSGTQSAGPESSVITTVKTVYVPAQYANSDGIPAVYMTKPKISYKFKQIPNQRDIDGGHAVLETPISSFGVDIRPVNQPPTVALNVEVNQNWLSWPADYSELSDAACSSHCTFEQNLGVQYPSLPAPIVLYFSGSDVDSANLDVVITSVTCVEAGVIVNSTATNAPVVVGSVLNTLSANHWAAFVSFLPTQDGAAQPYCTIKYKVRDEISTSADEGTIVIDITSTPSPPRSEDIRVFAPKLLPTPFEFAARSVNDKNADGSPARVNVAKMTITQCVGDVSSTLVIDGVTVNCGALPQSIAVTSNANDVLTGPGYQHTFTGVWTPTAASALEGFEIQVTFSDDDHLGATASLTSPEYTFSFAYRALNYPPQLQLIAPGMPFEFGTDLRNTIHFKLEGNQGGGSVGFHLRDDAGSTEGIYEVLVEIIGAEGNANIQFPPSEGIVEILQDGRKFRLQSTVAGLDAVLSGMVTNVFGVSKAQYNITVKANDQGFSGACSAEDATPCDMFANALLIIDANSNAPIVAYGLAAGAGGAALAAAAAAAIAWKTLRTPPTESYNPWAMDDATEGTVMNPLFEEAGGSGSNPMFESAGK